MTNSSLEWDETLDVTIDGSTVTMRGCDALHLDAFWWSPHCTTGAIQACSDYLALSEVIGHIPDPLTLREREDQASHDRVITSESCPVCEELLAITDKGTECVECGYVAG